MGALRTLTLTGADLAPWIATVAELRIRVFREYPYLYEGSAAYEEKYLQTYVQSSDSIVVLALDGEAVVGASTGLPLVQEVDALLRPFGAHEMAPERIFYCGESILLPSHRGRGLYREFFAERERQARRLGLDTSVFCCVQRPTAHPLRPADYRPLDRVWRHFGYRAQPQLHTTFRWKDVDESRETDKPMVFWLKSLA